MQARIIHANVQAVSRLRSFSQASRKISFLAASLKRDNKLPTGIVIDGDVPTDVRHKLFLSGLPSGTMVEKTDALKLSILEPNTFYQSGETETLSSKKEESLASSLSSVAGSEDCEVLFQDCSVEARKAMAPLFLSKRSEIGENFTAVTFAQKTKNDMSVWNEAVEEEREKLLGEFMSMAQSLSGSLKEAGYWADFIDPVTGVPFFSPETPDTLLETDERMRRLGFEVDDLGCCRVLRHTTWGRHVYGGVLFTNAPSDSPIMKMVQGALKA